MKEYSPAFQEKLREKLLTYADNLAIDSPDSQLTYAELSKQSDAVTQALLAQNLPEQAVVGVYLHNKAAIVASIIGILNARCAFVILDHDLPDGRLESMVSRTRLASVIYSDQQKPVGFWTKTVQHLSFEAALQQPDAAAIELPKAQGTDAIYVYFTSGSTGEPKGIVGKNASLLHFIEWEAEAFGFTETSRTSQLIRPGFDAFLRDVFTPLFTGGTICIPPNEADFLTPERLKAWLSQQNITHVHCVPSVFRLIEQAAFRANRTYG